jgi:ribose transport system substrate-binding protein
MMKKPVFFLLGILVALGAACTRRGKEVPAAIKIGVSVPNTGNAWSGHAWIGALDWWARRGEEELRAGAEEAPELKILAARDVYAQILQVEDLAEWGMGYLVVYPGDPAILAPILKVLHGQGIKILVVDRDLGDPSFGYVHLTVDHREGGRLSGQWLSREMKAAGLANYIALGGFPGPAGGEWMEAFFSEMSREISLVNLFGRDHYESVQGSNPQEGRRLTEAYLRRFPRIDALYCQDDEVLPGVLEAIRASGRSDIKILLGGGGSWGVYRMILEGHPLVRATVLYHPSLIREAIRYTAKAAREGTFPSSPVPVPVLIPPVLIDISNVHTYYEADSPY